MQILSKPLSLSFSAPFCTCWVSYSKYQLCVTLEKHFWPLIYDLPTLQIFQEELLESQFWHRPHCYPQLLPLTFWALAWDQIHLLRPPQHLSPLWLFQWVSAGSTVLNYASSFSWRDLSDWLDQLPAITSLASVEAVLAGVPHVLHFTSWSSHRYSFHDPGSKGHLC